jgi:sugar lactone lactonase YvrE
MEVGMGIGIQGVSTLGLAALLAAGCVSQRSATVTTSGAGVAAASSWPAQLPRTALVATVTGFSGPEAVRYDADQDVYFVANFNGGGNDRDDNGFISRVDPEGRILDLRFIEGGRNGVTLHAPRGMYIAGDTLWAADVDAVRGFHRRTGAALATVDFSSVDVGFLNDIARGSDGALYVTDTGRNRIYRILGGRLDGTIENTAFGSPNGITWDPNARAFVVVPWAGSTDISSFDPATGRVRVIGRGQGARYDGVEVTVGGRILVASQRDSAVHVFEAGTGRPLFRTAGAPADIGLDTRRLRVAVPFIAMNAVEIWQLPR